MTRDLFYPFIDTLMFAFPHTLTEVEAEPGIVVSIEVTTDIGGIWSIIKTANGWSLDKNNNFQASAKLFIDPETAWKLFSKSWKPEQVISKVKIDGDSSLAKQALHMVAVMA